MRFNPDKVPATHADAVRAVLDGLELHEVETINAPGFSMVDVHFTLGRFLRNSWSLWDQKTVLVRHYIDTYRLGHADDISSLILEEVAARVQGRLFDPKPVVERSHAHWREHGIDPVTGVPLAG